MTGFEILFTRAASPPTLQWLTPYVKRVFVSYMNLTLLSTKCLCSIATVAEHSLFYRFFDVYFVELSSRMPQLGKPANEILQTVASHRYTVQLPTSRTVRFYPSYVSRRFKLWYTMRSGVFSQILLQQIYPS